MKFQKGHKTAFTLEAMSIVSTQRRDVNEFVFITFKQITRKRTARCQREWISCCPIPSSVSFSENVTTREAVMSADCAPSWSQREDMCYYYSVAVGARSIIWENWRIIGAVSPRHRGWCSRDSLQYSAKLQSVVMQWKLLKASWYSSLMPYSDY
jgi:hypothetical protein